MKASELVTLLQERIAEHGDLPVSCCGGEPLYSAPVGDVVFRPDTGMDGDLPNPHFHVDCR